MSATRQERWNQMKPKKPKKPATKFAFFVSDFKRKNNGLEPNELFYSASHAWKRLNGDEKRKFENEEAWQEYKKVMQEYKTKSSAMKEPPSAFALFVQAWWREYKPKMPRRQNARRREFGNVSIRISKAWKSKTKVQRATYVEKAALLKKIFEREQEQVVSQKRPLNLNWLAEGLEEASATVGKKRRQDEDSQTNAGSQNDNNEERESNAGNQNGNNEELESSAGSQNDNNEEYESLD